MDQNTIDRLGDELYQALVAREVLAPLTERHPGSPSRTPIACSSA